MTTSCRLVPFVLLAGLLSIAQAQPPEFVMWSAAELARRDVALSANVGPDHSARETLLDYRTPARSHRFRFIRRDADGVPEQHAQIEDVVFIQSGAGTLQVGGELVGLLELLSKRHTISHPALLNKAGTRGIDLLVGRGIEVFRPQNLSHTLIRVIVKQNCTQHRSFCCEIVGHVHAGIVMIFPHPPCLTN